jgi:hypothetical protein
VLLNLAFEFLAAAIDGSQVIIGELTPLLLDLAFDLLPVSLPDKIEFEGGFAPTDPMGFGSFPCCRSGFGPDTAAD